MASYTAIEGIKFMKNIFINELKPDAPIKAVFLCKKKVLKKTKDDKPYLEITLSDKTGKIEARAWENAEEFNKIFSEGDIIKIKGVTALYKKDLQVKIDSVEKASEGEYSYEDLIKRVENPEKILENIKGLLDGMKNEWLLKLKDGFLNDKTFMEKFTASPGAKSWHNAYIGGLMEHTYEVIFISEQISRLYPEADKDILILGSFIHDMGKIFELDSNTFDYTVEGGLIGHVVIGYKMLKDKIEKIDSFPAELSLSLEHIILSHHGEYEQQSPVLPKTLEATIIYHSDDLVSQANAVKELQETRIPSGDAIWSNFVSIKNRKYLLKKQL